MKKILVVLSVIGLIPIGAMAQSQHSKNDINYKVCRTANGNYKVCSGPYNGVKENNVTVTPARRVEETSNYELLPDAKGITPISRGRSKYDVNYKVCLVGDQYKVCNPEDPAIQRTNRPNVIASSQSVNTGNTASMSMSQGGIYMGYTSKKKSNIRVTDEDNMNDRLDKEADGKEKATYRNMNYNNGSVSLPPNDGGISDR